MKYLTKEHAVWFLSGAFVVFALVYFTPLKNLNILEPMPKDIEPREFYEAYKKNPDKYIFLDVRDSSLYAKLHAEGARNLPIHLLYDERHVLPKRGKEIVLICSAGRLAGVAAMYLEHYGFMNVLRVKGGMEAWVNEGLPTVSQQAIERTPSVSSLLDLVRTPHCT